MHEAARGHKEPPAHPHAHCRFFTLGTCSEATVKDNRVVCQAAWGGLAALKP